MVRLHLSRIHATKILILQFYFAADVSFGNVEGELKYVVFCILTSPNQSLAFLIVILTNILIFIVAKNAVYFVASVSNGSKPVREVEIQVKMKIRIVKKVVTMIIDLVDRRMMTIVTIRMTDIYRGEEIKTPVHPELGWVSWDAIIGPIINSTASEIILTIMKKLAIKSK